MIPYLTEEQILQIRREWDAGKIDTRAWAEALDVSMETIRRIGRRDTYRKLAGGGGGMRARPQVVQDVLSNEPTSQETAASMARLASLLEEQQAEPRAVNAMLDEMKGERRES